MKTETHNLIILKELKGNAPVHLSPFQEFLEPYTQGLIIFWIAVWCATIIFVVVKIIREYITHRKVLSS